MACKTEGQMDRRKLQYKKILQLDAIANTLASTYNVPINKESVPVGTFEDIIDLNRAHACLEGHMNNAEYRFAYAVTYAYNQGVSIDEISNFIKAAGVSYKVENDTIETVFNDVQNNILDGMPCDETIQIVEYDGNHITWEIIEDMHSSFWNKVDGNADHYYQLLKAYIAGLLTDTDYMCDISNNRIITIKRK